MAVPSDLASDSEVLEVKDRSAWSGSLADESFRLGSYAVQDVDRDWDSSTGFSVGNFSRESSEGGYAFKLAGGAAPWSGKCVSKAADNDVALGAGLGMEFKFAELACSCEADGQRPATVFVKGNGEQFSGQAVLPAGEVELRSVHDVEGGSSQSQPTGYRMDGAQPLGAVEVLRPGRVWLKKSVPAEARDAVVCLFAGLMLYAPPKDD